MTWSALGMLAFLTQADVVAPRESQTSESPSAEVPTGKLLRPLHADARLSVDADILLIYISVSAAVDVGLLKLGPGTLAVGANADLGFCGSFCWATAALLSSAFQTPTTYSQTHFFPSARLSYHFPIPASKSKSAENVNVYGLLLGGPVFTSLSLKNKGLEISGNDTSIGVGLGIGGQYFFTERFFVGAEATGRYARGRYNWTVRLGDYRLSDSEASWSLTGISVRFAVGIRL
jgi:hypothetical protein